MYILFEISDTGSKLVFIAASYYVAELKQLAQYRARNSMWVRTPVIMQAQPVDIGEGA